MKHAIKHRYTDAVLFEGDVSDDMASGMRTRAVLRQAVSAGANLAGVNLEEANLAGANLEGAYLEEANLEGAYLEGANLEGANLEGANLEGANLGGTYLGGANLAGANLEGAYLEGANLARANLEGAKWTDKITIIQRPIQLYGLQWPVTVLDQHMQIGCRLHSLHDWEQFDNKAIAEMDGHDALRFWHAHKDALLGLARGAGRSFDKMEA